jgi:TM2 domain-containing membrane protein YozV
MLRVIDVLPQVDGAEANYLQTILTGLSDDDARRFAAAYSIRRKDSGTMLLLALVGFIGVAGIHRFVLGQVGMGILYLFTGGLCAIGTIVDLVNIKKLTQEYNMQVAGEVMSMIR